MKASKQQGVTYLAVLFLIAVIGVWLAAAGTLWSVQSNRDKEGQLFDAGHAYRDAIRRYYESSPGTVKRYPIALEELVVDRRFLTTRRHLRKLYADPVEDHQEWGLVRASDGGIMGVFSQSKKRPFKTGNFEAKDIDFEGGSEYADWKFTYVPPNSKISAAPR